jgi:Holliday junction resolvase RusA-like endonuclease
MIIRFTVWGEPTAKGRPRFSFRGKIARAYTPAKTAQAENNLRAQAMPHRPVQPLEAPLLVAIRVFRPVPKSMSKKRTDLAEKGHIRPVTKPDIDNYQKLIYDALNGIFWRDDSQIVESRTTKFYSTTPRVEIEILEIII